MKVLKGYKLKNDKYLYNAKKIAGIDPNIGAWSRGEIAIHLHTQRYETFKELDLLDVWFEPVYEICDYECGDLIKYTGGENIYVVGKVFSNSKGLQVKCNLYGEVAGDVYTFYVSSTQKATSIEVDNFLVSKAKLKYPKNTVFINTAVGRKFVVSNDDFIINEFGIISNEGFVYYKNEWAEIDVDKTSILKQLLEKYPVGTKFCPAHVKKSNEFCIITNDKFLFTSKFVMALTDDNYVNCENEEYGNTSLNRIVWYNGIYADIIPNFTIYNYKVELFDNYIEMDGEKIPVSFIQKLYHSSMLRNVNESLKKELYEIIKYYK